MAFEYSALDPDGAPFTIPAGEPFTTYWVVEDGETTAEEYAHPWNVLDLWDEAELARFGVTKTAVADPPPPVPDTISASQLKRFLRTMVRTDGQAGTLRTQVDAMIAGSGDGDLQDYWAYTSDFHRDHPRLLAMVQAIHLTSDQVDAAFIAASHLT